MNGYPKWFRWVVIMIALFAFISGCLLAPTVFDLKLAWDMPWRLPGGDRVLVAALHTGAAFLMAAVFGTLWTTHMRSNWRFRRNRIGGSLLAGLLVLLCLTGLGIFYFGEETLSLFSSLGHTALGLAAPLLFVQHIYAGRKSAAARRRSIIHRRLSARDADLPCPGTAGFEDIDLGREQTLH